MQFKWHKNKITSTSQVYLIGGSKGKQTSEAGRLVTSECEQNFPSNTRSSIGFRFRNKAMPDNRT